MAWSEVFWSGSDQQWPFLRSRCLHGATFDPQGVSGHPLAEKFATLEPQVRKFGRS